MNPAGAWSRFWFTPRSGAMITAVRASLGLTCLAWALSILPDLRAFYFDGSVLLQPTYADHRIGLLQWWDSDLGATLVFCAFVLAAFAVFLGVGVRVAAPLLWYTLLSLEQQIPNVLNAGDLLLRIWAFYFAVFALLTPQRYLGQPFLGRPAPDGGPRTWTPTPAWIIRIFQIQLTVIYVATIIEKIPGTSWREGTAATLALGLEPFERFPVPDLVRENLVLGNIFTWATIGLEVALPFLLWTRRTRRFAIVAGLGMHLAFDYAMRVGFFLPAMAIGYLCFLTDDELTRLLRWRPKRRSRADRTEPVVEAAPDRVDPAPAAP